MARNFTRELGLIVPCVQITQRAGFITAQLIPIGIQVLPTKERELKAAVRCVLRALSALHRAGIVHRDVRWSNIVLLPETHGAHWVLIDLENAAPTGTAPTWYHETFPPEYEGERKSLPWTSAFDIHQVGRLFDDMKARFPAEEVSKFARYLQNDRPSAEVALTHPWLRGATEVEEEERAAD